MHARYTDERRSRWEERGDESQSKMRSSFDETAPTKNTPGAEDRTSLQPKPSLGARRGAGMISQYQRDKPVEFTGNKYRDHEMRLHQSIIHNRARLKMEQQRQKQQQKTANKHDDDDKYHSYESSLHLKTSVPSNGNGRVNNPPPSAASSSHQLQQQKHIATSNMRSSVTPARPVPTSTFAHHESQTTAKIMMRYSSQASRLQQRQQQQRQLQPRKVSPPPERPEPLKQQEQYYMAETSRQEEDEEEEIGELSLLSGLSGFSKPFDERSPEDGKTTVNGPSKPSDDGEHEKHLHQHPSASNHQSGRPTPDTSQCSSGTTSPALNSNPDSASPHFWKPQQHYQHQQPFSTHRVTPPPILSQPNPRFKLPPPRVSDPSNTYEQYYQRPPSFDTTPSQHGAYETPPRDPYYIESPPIPRRNVSPVVDGSLLDDDEPTTPQELTGDKQNLPYLPDNSRVGAPSSPKPRAVGNAPPIPPPPRVADYAPPALPPPRVADYAPPPPPPPRVASHAPPPPPPPRVADYAVDDSTSRQIPTVYEEQKDEVRFSIPPPSSYPEEEYYDANQCSDSIKAPDIILNHHDDDSEKETEDDSLFGYLTEESRQCRLAAIRTMTEEQKLHNKGEKARPPGTRNSSSRRRHRHYDSTTDDDYSEDSYTSAESFSDIDADDRVIQRKLSGSPKSLSLRSQEAWKRNSGLNKHQSQQQLKQAQQHRPASPKTAGKKDNDSPPRNKVSWDNSDTIHNYLNNNPEDNSTVQSSLESGYSKTMEHGVVGIVKDIFMMGGAKGSQPMSSKKPKSTRYHDDDTLTTEDGSEGPGDRGGSKSRGSPDRQKKSRGKGRNGEDDNPEEDPLLTGVWNMVESAVGALGLLSNDEEDDDETVTIVSEDTGTLRSETSGRDEEEGTLQSSPSNVGNKKNTLFSPPPPRPPPATVSSSKRITPAMMEIVSNNSPDPPSESASASSDDMPELPAHKPKGRSSVTPSSSFNASALTIDQDLRLIQLAMESARMFHKMHGFEYDDSKEVDIVNDIKFVVADLHLPMGAVFQENKMGCWITQIVADGSAAKTGIQVGDQLAAIDGISAIHMKIDDIAQVVRQKRDGFELILLRYVGKLYPLPTFDHEAGFEIKARRSVGNIPPVGETSNANYRSSSAKEPEARQSTAVKSTGENARQIAAKSGAASTTQSATAKPRDAIPTPLSAAVKDAAVPEIKPKKGDPPADGNAVSVARRSASSPAVAAAVSSEGPSHRDSTNSFLNKRGSALGITGALARKQNEKNGAKQERKANSSNTADSNPVLTKEKKRFSIFGRKKKPES